MVGLVLLLAVGTGLALRSSWGRGNHADRNIVAAYDGGVITRETLLERWRTAPADQQATMRTPEGIDLTVRSMAVHAVLERWARERQLDAREMFTRAMREASQEIGIHDVEQWLHESEIRVEEGATKRFITKGDNNNDADSDPVIPQNVIGKIVFNVPKIGWLAIIVKGFFTG